MPRLARRGRASARELPLALFYAASAVAYIRSQEWPGAWLLLGAVAAGLLLEFSEVDDRLRRRGERDAWILVGLTAVVGIGWTLYALVSDALLALLRGVIGSGLVLMGAFFAAGRKVWRPERGLIPTGLGALALAGLDPLAPVAIPGGVAVLALLTWLALDRPTRRPHGAPARPPLGLALFAVLSSALAVGIAIALPLAQPLVEQAAADVLSTGSDGVSGLSSNARLGDIENLALSREVVLRLWSDRPLRLRAHALTTFSGRTWTGAAGTPRPLPRKVPEPGGELGRQIAELPGVTFGAPGPLPPDVRWTRMLVAQLERGRLVTPQNPLVVRVAGGTPLVDSEAGLLHTPFWPSPRLYGVAHGHTPPRPLPDEERAAALQLPEGLDARMRALAHELGEGAPGDRERLERTVRWIGDCCDYSLQVGSFRSSQPVAEFLFDKRRGYCEYFASSAAMLLRLQGVPTRYVSGFNVRDHNRVGDYYLVRASDAHAWVEAWIEGEGWVEADPTPAAQYDAMREGMREGLFARLWEAVTAFFAELRARFSQDGGDTLRWLGRRLAGLGRWLWAHVAEVAALAGLLAVGVLAWRRRGRGAARRAATVRPAPASAVGPALGSLVDRLEERWSELGHPRPPHRPPLEHLLSLPRDEVPEAVREAARGVVDCYYQARYGGRAADADTLEGLRRRLEES